MSDTLLDHDGDGSGEFFRHIVMESADAVVAIDLMQRIVLFNPAAESVFGYRREDILGKPLETLLPHRFRKCHAGKVEEFHAQQSPARYMGDRKSHLVGLCADGTEVMLGSTILTVATPQGPVMVAMLRDISERIRLQTELARLASADPLTGQLNRRAFLESLDREWQRAFRYKSGLSLVMFDLDHFKSVNDTFGHDAGDRVICEFSELARGALRDIDIFGRWGGEEFIAALPHADLRAARVAAERIREAVARRRFNAEGDGPLRVTVSIGVADIREGRSPLQQMIKDADHALYEAKNNGRNQVVIWNGAGSIRALASGGEG